MHSFNSYPLKYKLYSVQFNWCPLKQNFTYLRFVVVFNVKSELHFFWRGGLTYLKDFCGICATIRAHQEI